MAYQITSECINCCACESECPNKAISQGENVFEINPALCTECVGFHDLPQCAVVCPVDVCITDPNMQESEDVLIAKVKKLHPNIEFTGDLKSHLKNQDKK